MKNKNSQKIKDSFENNLQSFKGKPNLGETDRRKEYFNSFFQKFLNKNNTKHFFQE